MVRYGCVTSSLDLTGYGGVGYNFLQFGDSKTRSSFKSAALSEIYPENFYLHMMFLIFHNYSKTKILRRSTYYTTVSEGIKIICIRMYLFNK